MTCPKRCKLSCDAPHGLNRWDVFGCDDLYRRNRLLQRRFDPVMAQKRRKDIGHIDPQIVVENKVDTVIRHHRPIVAIKIVPDIHANTPIVLRQCIQNR